MKWIAVLPMIFCCGCSITHQSPSSNIAHSEFWKDAGGYMHYYFVIPDHACSSVLFTQNDNGEWLDIVTDEGSNAVIGGYDNQDDAEKAAEGASTCQRDRSIQVKGPA
jgi:hypothetical protein